jgi:2-hydroxychromene-2-carboxylate isomerase
VKASYGPGADSHSSRSRGKLDGRIDGQDELTGAPVNPFERLRGTRPLVVYIDLKSPYAFISIAPTRAVVRAAGVAVEWRPFTLDIPSYLGSARLDQRGKVAESNRTPAQWRGVRYAYRDARRYARLAGNVLRGTEKIWDSSIAGIGLLWAQRQSPTIADAYLDDSYARFWRRELDIEDPAVVAAQLDAAGADTAGFADFLAGPGRVEHDRINAAAFGAGVFGVPGYLVADEYWFGREHLPRVGWLLGGRVGPAPDVAYPIPQNAALADAGLAIPMDAGGTPRVRVALDIRDAESWLAFEPLRRMGHELGVPIEWLPFEVARQVPAAARPDDDRGATHLRLRAEQAARSVACYAGARGLAMTAPERGADATIVHRALLWASQRGAAAADAFLANALAAWWSGTLDATDTGQVARLLERSGVPVTGFGEWCAAEGATALAETRAELLEAGVIQVPTVLVGDEPFHGRGHVPLIRAALEGLRTRDPAAAGGFERTTGQ